MRVGSASHSGGGGWPGWCLAVKSFPVSSLAGPSSWFRTVHRPGLRPGLFLREEIMLLPGPPPIPGPGTLTPSSRRHPAQHSAEHSGNPSSPTSRQTFRTPTRKHGPHDLPPSAGPPNPAADSHQPAQHDGHQPARAAATTTDTNQPNRQGTTRGAAPWLFRTGNIPMTQRPPATVPDPVHGQRPKTWAERQRQPRRRRGQARHRARSAQGPSTGTRQPDTPAARRSRERSEPAARTGQRHANRAGGAAAQAHAQRGPSRSERKQKGCSERVPPERKHDALHNEKRRGGPPGPTFFIALSDRPISKTGRVGYRRRYRAPTSQQAAGFLRGLQFPVGRRPAAGVSVGARTRWFWRRR